MCLVMLSSSCCVQTWLISCHCMPSISGSRPPHDHSLGGSCPGSDATEYREVLCAHVTLCGFPLVQSPSAPSSVCHSPQCQDQQCVCPPDPLLLPSCVLAVWSWLHIQHICVRWACCMLLDHAVCTATLHTSRLTPVLCQHQPIAFNCGLTSDDPGAWHLGCPGRYNI